MHCCNQYFTHCVFGTAGNLKISNGTVPYDVTQEAWCASSNLEDSYSLNASDLVKAGIAEYNTYYEDTVEGSEDMIVTHPLHLICYDKTRFQQTQKCTSTNTNFKRTMCASGGGTGEVLLSRYE